MIGDPYPDMHNRKQGRDKSKQNGREEKKKAHTVTTAGRQAHALTSL